MCDKEIRIVSFSANFILLLQTFSVQKGNRVQNHILSARPHKVCEFHLVFCGFLLILTWTGVLVYYFAVAQI